MRKSIELLLRYLIFWMTYFWLSKIVFLLVNYKLSSGLDLSEILKVFYIGGKMDLSMTGYFTILPGLILTFSFLFSSKLLSSVFKWYTSILLVFTSFLNVIDLSLYPHWGSRIGINAFSTPGNIKFAIKNVEFFDGAIILILLMFFLLLGFWLYKNIVGREVKKQTKFKWYLAPVILFITATLIYPIRGGFRSWPLNHSSVAFSDKLYANQSSVNFMWFFFNSIERKNSFKNPCIYFPDDQMARSIFDEFEQQRAVKDSIIIQSENKTPNVILIVLESFSNKVLTSFGGEYNVCPNLDSISKESVIFPSFYASGNRSDRGLAALLGGYPSLLDMSIINFPEKSDKLTTISEYFSDHNYFTSFYYGGNIDIYDLRSFVLQGEFDEVVSDKNFDRELQNLSSWGVPDGYLFERVLNDVKKKEAPFFTVAYTLSSHAPFDVPVKMVEGQSVDARFLNSVAYTDSCVGAFIRKFKTSPQWENTWVIITSDHGAIYPGGTSITDPVAYRIPMIWTGGVIEKQGEINRLGGQPDFIPTVLGQLGWEEKSHLFGHSLFSRPAYAFYMLESGWGYITDEEKVYFDQLTGVFNGVQKEGHSNKYDFAKAYLQVLHNDFLSK